MNTRLLSSVFVLSLALGYAMPAVAQNGAGLSPPPLDGGHNPLAGQQSSSGPSGMRTMSPKARQAYRRELRRQLRKQARQQGLNLSDQTPPPMGSGQGLGSGQGTGSRPGMGPGQGMGAGHGMGSGGGMTPGPGMGSSHGMGSGQPMAPGGTRNPGRGSGLGQGAPQDTLPGLGGSGSASGSGTSQ